MASVLAGSPDGDARAAQAQTRARRGPACAGLLVASLAVLGILLVIGSPASAANEDLHVPEPYQHVLEGDSVAINVTFGTAAEEDNEDEERTEKVRVRCREADCVTWEREVTWRESKANCEETQAFVGQEGAQTTEHVCQISFPDGFTAEDNPSLHAVEKGEPARAATYDVSLGPFGEKAGTEFAAHLTTASTCRPVEGTDPATGVAQRSDSIRLAVSGYPEGEQVTLTIRDGQHVLVERSWTSPGEHVPFHPLRWDVPIDAPISNEQRTLDVIVDAPSGSEREKIYLRPAVAQPMLVREPGFLGQKEVYNRTEQVQVWTQFAFFSAPLSCLEVAWNRDLTPVTEDQLDDDPPEVLVRRLNDEPHPQPVQTVDTHRSELRTANDIFVVNYTIRRTEEVTNEDDEDPVYDFKYEKTRLTDGNYIGPYNSSDYQVQPYTIEPEYVVLQDEVERLETARLVLNLTYADGTPFTPNETDRELEIAFGLEGEQPEFTEVANHRRAGIWNVSIPLGFEYEPLGPYTWRIQETPDDADEPNRLPETITDVVDVLSARPRLNMTTTVNDEVVNGTERTQRVHVRVDARFKNGEPLTEDRIDPSLGGLVLNVNKRNEFGRVVDQDRFVMTDVGRQGTWIDNFRIGRSPSTAPVGEWHLEIEARDDRSPPNENISSFPFQVDPANVSVTDAKSPPALADGETVTYRFRLHYPDGTLVSERLLDESRGGRLDLTLERLPRPDQEAIVERELDPRPISGGQAWEVELNTSKMVLGNHFFNLSGQDIHGNPIGPRASDMFTVLFDGEFRNSTSPICPETEGDQPCEIGRGETVHAVFPGSSGDKGMFEDRPVVRVHRKNPDIGGWIVHRSDVWLSPQQYFNLTGRDVGENHVGRFLTDRSTPTGTYRLMVLGRASDDTGFAGFSQTFNVTRVPVERDVIQPFPDRAKKTQEITARIQHEAGDVVDNARADVGPVTVRNIETTTTGVGTFVTWRPPASIPTGPAAVTVEGRDLFGNPFQVELGPIQLDPVEIRVEEGSPIPDQAARGETTSFDVRMTYETGSEFQRSDGKPEVVVRDLSGNQVDAGNASTRPGRWEITWTPRADLPKGAYKVAVSGTDRAGNVVNEYTTPPIEVTSGTVTGEVAQSPAGRITRGDVATATIEFPTEIADGEATVTTGSDELEGLQSRINGSTVELRFPTDRSTELVDAMFTFEGTDVVGNDLEASTERFTIQPQTLQVTWLQSPSSTATLGEPVEAAFVVEYPDGSYMRPGEGVAIVGLFAFDQPLGQIEAEPHDENRALWQVSWDPPEDARTDVPYHFSASARDTHRNQALPVSTTGFYVQNPVVPDYVPVHGPGTAAAIAALAGLALVARRVRHD